MNIKFTEAEQKRFQLTARDLEFAEQFEQMALGEDVDPVNMREFLASPSAMILIPKVIVGTMREVAEPMYIGTSMLTKIRLKQGQSMIFPSIGVMRAFDVAEGQEFPEDTIDWQTHETPEIRVNKSGIRIRVTDEMISDNQWDVVSMLVREAGRAMARHKEEKAFKQFSKHGHTVFDNNLRTANPDAGTTGKDIDGNMNDTLSAEDFLDIIIAVMNNEFTPSDVLLHPLSWSAFAKNELSGMVAGNPYGTYPATGDPKNFQLGPNSIAGRLPFAFNIQLSPFIPFDKTNKTFDMYVVDKANIGVLLVKDDISTEQFDEPARDMHNVKIKERYGIGILNEGRAISVAKNISIATSYNDPIRVKTVTA
jgi:HK97 family phage major capsid protein